MAAFKCVHTQNSQRVAGNNYQLHPAAVKIINDLTYKPAYFGFTAGPVRRTRRIAHINKILLRQRHIQTFKTDKPPTPESKTPIGAFSA